MEVPPNFAHDTSANVGAATLGNLAYPPQSDQVVVPVYRNGPGGMYAADGGSQGTAPAVTVPSTDAYKSFTEDSRHHDSSSISLPVSAISLSWQDISYDVPTTAVDPTTKQKSKITKRILSNLSGMVKPGEMLAICGPSGGGKTTLLDAIAGRIDGTKSGRCLTGQVLVNGQPRTDSNWRGYATYVQQEHALQTAFTVRETMGYAADLLMNNSKHSKAERKQIAAQIIDVLGLSSCADTIVGDVFRKGLSGGQLRRLSIAIELIANPSILLLDEPTSGLDSAAAENVMKHLTDLARMGRTVICTIHQPPTEVWNRFDKFCLLSQGKCLYFGPANQAVDWFSQNNYPCPQLSNPADYFLRLANTDFAGHADVDGLAAKFVEGAHGKALMANLSAPVTNPIAPNSSFPNGFFTQFLILAHRAFFNNARNPGIFLVRLIMYFGLSLMVGLMYLNLGDSVAHSDIVSRVSLLFYVAAFLVFMSVAVLPFFIFERNVFVRERANGWYPVPAYVLATFLMSLPGLFLISLVSTTLVVLPAELNGYWIFLLDLFLSLVVAEAYMAVIASLVPHYIIGIALGAATYGFFMLCEGFLIVKSDIPDYFIWGHYIAFHTYSFRPFMVNEFEPIKHFDSQQFPTGNSVIEFYEMDDKPIWKDMLVLIGYALALQIIFALILQTCHKGKR